MIKFLRVIGVVISLLSLFVLLFVDGPLLIPYDSHLGISDILVDSFKLSPLVLFLIGLILTQLPYTGFVSVLLGGYINSIMFIIAFSLLTNVTLHFLGYPHLGLIMFLLMFHLAVMFRGNEFINMLYTIQHEKESNHPDVADLKRSLNQSTESYLKIFTPIRNAALMTVILILVNLALFSGVKFSDFVLTFLITLVSSIILSVILRFLEKADMKKELNNM